MRGSTLPYWICTLLIIPTHEKLQKNNSSLRFNLEIDFS